jgi:hypothetical protein
MFRMQLRTPHYASLIVCIGLSTVVSVSAQQVVSSGPAASAISLAPNPKPVSQSLARLAGDSAFEKVPENYHVFAAATVGERNPVETLLLTFGKATTLKSIALTNKNFALEPGGSCYAGNHYGSGDSCSLLVRFTPRGAGRRLGFVKIENSAEITPAFVGLVGNGYAPVVSFTPAQITTVAGTVQAGTGTINSATNLAVDGGDTLYIPDVGNNTIKIIDSSGAIGTLTPAFATPQSIVADSSGFLYSLNKPASTYYFSFYAPWGTQSAYGYTHTAGTCTPSAPCSIASVGMSKPANINIDPYDNLFFEEGTKGAAEMPVAGLAAGSGGLNLWYLTNQFVYSSGTPASYAVDANDNLYNFYNWGTTVCYLQEESAYQAEYAPVAKRVAGGATCGFSGDGGQARSAEISSTIGQITFDVAGNLYFADAGNQRIRRIDASTGVISTIAGNGISGYGGDGGSATTTPISNPTGLAVDSQGQVYILSNAPIAGPTQVIRKLGVNGYWKFVQIKGVASPAKVFTVANTGNSTLTWSVAPYLNGANVADFKIDPDTTSCVMTAGASLAAGRSCKVGIIFQPSATGIRNAILMFQDNTLNGTNMIQLVGNGVLAPTMSITSPTAGSTAAPGTTVTFSVSVTATGAKPTGTVTFKVNGTALGGPVALNSSGVASKTFSETTTATYSLSATYNGDSNYAVTTKTENLIVSAPNPMHLTAGTPGAVRDSGANRPE